MASGAADEELRLGRYVLKRPLGEGGNGQVFLAWQENAAGEPLVCVVKFPLQRFATQPAARERFMEEARLAMRLGTHPNIVQVIDVGMHQQMPFFVMEYVDGTDLNRLLGHRRRGKKPLSLASTYNILAGAASALHHAHVGATVARKPVGVVHRDVKPGNILVTRDGAVKLGDFGIGTTVEEGTSGSYMRGTYRYMSPEHISREVRPEMDIYALGVVAWEMVENRIYREGFEGTQHFTAIMDGDVPPMENPDTPPELVGVIEACLEPNPRQRPNARELLRALERCPGYTRDPSDLQRTISSLLGPHRSSGKTLHDFAPTPELVATLAALEVVAKPPRGKSAQPKVVVNTAQGPALVGEASDAADRDSVRAVESEYEASADGDGEDDDPEDDSEAVTGKLPAARPVTVAESAEPSVEDGGVEREADAPRVFRRRRPGGSPMPAEPIPMTTEHSVERVSPPNTDVIPPPWEQEELLPKAPAPEVEDVPIAVERGLTEPAPASAPRAPTTPGPIPVPVADTLESTTGSVAVEPGRAGASKLLFVAGVAVVAVAVLVALALGAFEASGKSPVAGKVASRAPAAARSESAPRLPVEPARDPEIPTVGHGEPEVISAAGPAEAPEERPPAELEHAPVDARADAPPAEPTPRPSPVTAPPADVKVVLFLLDEAEVKIGKAFATVQRGTDMQVPAGKHRIRWRSPGDSSWHDAGQRRFLSGAQYMVRLRSSGDAEVAELGPREGGGK